MVETWRDGRDVKLWLPSDLNWEMAQGTRRAGGLLGESAVDKTLAEAARLFGSRVSIRDARRELPGLTLHERDLAQTLDLPQAWGDPAWAQLDRQLGPQARLTGPDGDAEGELLGDPDGLTLGDVPAPKLGLPLGDTDGLAEGLSLGLALGDADGLSEGERLGLALGDVDGLADGERLGLVDGLALGRVVGAVVASDGLPLGRGLGDADGLVDGLELGLSDGENDGENEGDHDGDSDGDRKSTRLNSSHW